MTMPLVSPDLDLAHEYCTRAGRWLVILAFQTRPGAPTLSQARSSYEAMLDPAVPDARRLAVCRDLRPHVVTQVTIERWRWEEASVSSIVEPSEQAWRTTERGAALQAIAELLDEAIAGFERAGVSGA